MAQSAMYAQQQLHHGTLMPGQTIYVNQYMVQVERYLSQGGYAHVYLVRTPSPVFGTTRHVLKRIAVANEALLSEVKKEVDIMRILRGHPNIVYFIDAAWNMLPNGTYEVFILMEFCAGGGIIDMMNRRLRERLTEAEILQVFVDVCEAVAAMHNLRPPLLHRDLKVENILQTSETSFKLCDFGSAASISKPPTNSQEHRQLEADLNRHTTLQYRAPEMVDLYLRRPIDEKSDVWALGVLLYKLCYYTTPFEEHGVLAILNVQYKIPPYPVYSAQMNELIGSMLMELGVQRLSVFEVLDRVHKMRGTKSKFTYIQPSRQPLAPRIAASEVNPLDGVVAYKPSSMPLPVTNNGIQAREKVRDVVSPPRKERPRIGSPARLPLRGLPDDAILSSSKTEDDAWKSLKPTRVHKSGIVPSVAVDVWKSTNAAPITDNNPWSVRPYGKPMETPKEPLNSQIGFGESFNDLLSVSPAAFDKTSPGRLSSSPSNDNKPRTTLTSTMRQDAFESLNVFPSKGNAPTLGEQRSGLTTQSRTPTLQADNKFTTTPSPRPSTSTSWNSTSSPILSPSAPSNYDRTANDSFSAAEQRFPSLEELDSGYFPSFHSTSLPAPSRTDTSTITSTTNTPPKQDPAAPRLPPRPKANAVPIERPSHLRPTRSSFTGGLKSSITPSLAPIGTTRTEGVRSQHVTGTAMREAKGQSSKAPSPLSTSPSVKPDDVVNYSREQSNPPIFKMPGNGAVDVAAASLTNEKSPPSQDWLTGNDSVTAETLTPVLRASPEKRSSTILQQSHVVPVVPIWEQLQTSAPPKDKVTSLSDRSQLPSLVSLPKEQARQIPTYSTTATRTPQRHRGRKSISSSSESADTEDGPEDVISSVHYKPHRRETTSTLDSTPKASRAKNSHDVSPGADTYGDQSNLRRSHTQVRAPARKGRQSSVHDLVDLWGGGISSSGVAAASAAAAISSENNSDNAKAESGRRRSILLSSRIPGPRQGETQELSGLPSTYTTDPTFNFSGTTSMDQRRASPTKSNNMSATSYSTNTEATTSTVTPLLVETTSNSSIPKKARPQSMFASSQIQKASSDGPNSSTRLKSPEIAKSKSSFAQSLAPPSLNEVDEEGGATEADNRYSNRRPSRSPRRSSISNIVSQYEAIGAGVDAAGDAQSPKTVPVKSILTGRSGNGNDKPDSTLPTKASSSIRPSSPVRQSSSFIKERSTGVINDTGVGARNGAGRASTFTVPSGSSAMSNGSRSISASLSKSAAESVPLVSKQLDESFIVTPKHEKSPSIVIGEPRSANTLKSTVTPSVKPNTQIHKSRPSFGGVRAPSNIPPLKNITPPREEPSISSNSSNVTSLNNTEENMSARSTTNLSIESQENSSSAAFRTNQLHTPPVAPTPERAYQGVSRLIDQWQKKSEEAEINIEPPRGRGIGYKGRREGVVGAGGGTGSGIK